MLVASIKKQTNYQKWQFMVIVVVFLVPEKMSLFKCWALFALLNKNAGVKFTFLHKCAEKSMKAK